jgi:hypothetical protein
MPRTIRALEDALLGYSLNCRTMSLERHAAGERLLATRRELQNYYSFNESLHSVRREIAEGELSFDYEISDQLSSFVKRVTEFALEIDAFEDEMNQRFQNAAWDYLDLESSIST